MNLKLTSSKTPVVLEDVGGKTHTYELREMTAAQRDGYLDRLSARMGKDEEGKRALTKYEGLQADLISSCLFNEEGKAVEKDIIQTWPAAAVDQLFKEAQKLNRLDGEKAPEDPAKNG